MCLACIKKRIKENRFKLQQMDLNDSEWPKLVQIIQADEQLLADIKTGVKTKGCC